MIRKRLHNDIDVILLLVCCCLFLFACSPKENEDPVSDQPSENESLTLASLDIDYRLFQKVVGWFDETTLLVHLGDSEKQQLNTFDIFTGEMEQVYSTDSAILTIEMNQARDKILLQEIKDEQTIFKIVTKKGEVIQSTEFYFTSYVNFHWNPTNDNTAFVSHYNYDHELEVETMIVYIWDIEENSFSLRNIPSLSPKWYSENVYLYVNEQQDNGLYIGDVREDQEDMIINKDVSSFYINQDTFIGLVESDIMEDEVLLFHEYPFLIGDKVIRIPKVTANKTLIDPHFTQSTRNGKIFGVIPDYSFVMEEDLGSYHLAHLNFQKEFVNEIIELPENAPIALSPNEDYLLYGWRLEYIIDLSDPELIELLAILN
ncbi:hypothetical protein [Alkalibacterium kapii]|uniref:YqgU-like 6-bladed beta-propeller domain-containing protein n=1 Tax=Alkalibacterium kapii TaxID=426704 RepID=A0A511ASB6_9LACT|nr:hypothetical protein [Alkalibacterium kapii]GEK90642.1 hypothetical protein AKA01nite_02640 [Alkalibacterium kapii]